MNIIENITCSLYFFLLVELMGRKPRLENGEKGTARTFYCTPAKWAAFQSTLPTDEYPNASVFLRAKIDERIASFASASGGVTKVPIDTEGVKQQLKKINKDIWEIETSILGSNVSANALVDKATELGVAANANTGEVFFGKVTDDVQKKIHEYKPTASDGFSGDEWEDLYQLCELNRKKAKLKRDLKEARDRKFSSPS